MKQTKAKLLCLLLAVLMLLSSLTACGKEKTADSNLIKLDDYQLLYKGACIMTDSDGNDAIVLTLDFTNNGKDNASYLWGVDETVMQNGVELEVATVFTDYDTFETVIEGQFTDVAPGATVEVRTAYLLQDTTSPVEATFEQFFGKKSGKLTIDPSTLDREAPTPDTTDTEPPIDGTLTPTNLTETGDPLLDWWNGEWYGWWKMSGCYGYYESMEGKWWDVCGVIDIGTDYTGTITLWDEDYTRSEPMASAQVSLSKAGTGEHGTVMSEGGWFTNVALEHADWIVDPALLDYDDMIWISGDYENGDDEFHYDIYLRPWGLRWDDMEESTYPYSYTNWYLPLIDAGMSMPDAIGEDPSNDFNPHDSAPLTQTDATASGGDGIVTEEQVQTIQSEKGLVQPEWYEVCAQLRQGDEDIASYMGNDYQPVPPTVLKILTEQCGYTFVTPEDFRGNMTAAKLEFSGGETYTADKADLPALQRMLTNARAYGGGAACGFGAKLTVTFDDGRTVSVLKGTDSCASFTFGSWSSAMVSDSENRQFWQMFGVPFDE